MVYDSIEDTIIRINKMEIIFDILQDNVNLKNEELYKKLYNQLKIGKVMFGENDCSNRIKNILSDKYGYKLIAEILVLVVLSTAIGCTAENSIADESKFYNMTYAELEEYQPQSDEEKIQIARAMDKIPDSEISSYMAEKITDFCEKDSFAKLKTVSVYQDHTQLVYNDSKKALCNADVKIELELYPYNNVDIKTQAEDYCRKLYEHLCGYPTLLQQGRKCAIESTCRDYQSTTTQLCRALHNAVPV